MALNVGSNLTETVAVNYAETVGAAMELTVGGDPDVACARMYMQELRHETESGRFTVVYGVYHDRLARAGGHWWFEHRRYHTLTRSGAEDGAWDVFEFPHHLRLDQL